MNNKLSEEGNKIYLYRLKYIQNVNKYIEDIFYELSTIRGLEIKYNSDLSDKNYYLKKLDETIATDIRYKYTQLGIHHDNYIFNIGSNNLLYYGSQGQLRLAILSLKLAELQVMKNIFNIKPIVLLDDIFSELDIINRNNVIKYLLNDIQIIVTTTDINQIDKDLIKKSNIIDLNKLIERMNNNE